MRPAFDSDVSCGLRSLRPAICGLQKFRSGFRISLFRSSRFGDMISVSNKTLDVFKSDDHLKNHSVEPVFFDSALLPQEG